MFPNNPWLSSLFIVTSSSDSLGPPNIIDMYGWS